MIRLFVALELPPAMRDALLLAMGGISGARWQRDDQLHLTLRFIGEVDRHGAVDVAAALARVQVTPFALRLARVESLIHGGRIDSIWAGVTPVEAVAALARRVDQALRRVGFPAETRAFVPHITIARMPREAGPCDAIFDTIFTPDLFAFNHFALWESRLGSAGADYSVVERYGTPAR